VRIITAGNLPPPPGIKRIVLRAVPSLIVISVSILRPLNQVISIITVKPIMKRTGSAVLRIFLDFFIRGGMIRKES
jgi:hypothetical protein